MNNPVDESGEGAGFVMTADTITAIKKALEGVTPGPWELCAHLKHNDACSCGYRGVIYGPEPDGYAICQPGHEPPPEGQEGTEPPRYPRDVEIANMRFIAAVNPDAISELLSTLESLQRENEELRERQLAWRSMDSAPKDGKHCILSIPTGSGFIYSAQGVFRDGKWDNALNIDAQPLAWMPNVLLPDELCPWLKPDPAALSSTGDTHAE